MSSAIAKVRAPDSPPPERWVGLSEHLFPPGPSRRTRRRLRAARRFCFVAYAREDAPAVRPIIDAAEAEGFLLWTDWVDLPPGGLWSADIVAAIRCRSGGIGVLLSTRFRLARCLSRSGDGVAVQQTNSALLHRRRACARRVSILPVRAPGDPADRAGLARAPAVRARSNGTRAQEMARGRNRLPRTPCCNAFAGGSALA
jgi:hypothetical protein